MGIFDSFRNKAGDVVEKAKAGDLAGKAKEEMDNLVSGAKGQSGGSGDQAGQPGDQAGQPEDQATRTDDGQQS